MSVLQLYFAILVVLFISIIFMMVNVFFQLKIGSRISLLKQDLDRTNIEFSLLKKGREALRKAAKPITEIDTSTPLDLTISQQTVETGGIKIVRNIRGTFTETEAHLPDSPAHDQRPASGKNEYPQTPATPPHQTGIDPFISMYDIDETKQWFKNAADPFSAPPLQTPSAHGLPPRQPFQQPENSWIAIPLHSTATQGPDLNALYSTLMEQLTTQPDLPIAFDFAEIQFLHDQELDYLEELYRALLDQRRTLIFVNCGNQVSGLLQQRPNLAALIR